MQSDEQGLFRPSCALRFALFLIIRTPKISIKSSLYDYTPATPHRPHLLGYTTQATPQVQGSVGSLLPRFRLKVPSHPDGERHFSDSYPSAHSFYFSLADCTIGRALQWLFTTLIMISLLRGFYP